MTIMPHGPASAPPQRHTTQGVVVPLPARPAPGTDTLPPDSTIGRVRQDHTARPLPTDPGAWILAHVTTARQPGTPLTLERDAPEVWLASSLGFAGCVVYDDEVLPGWVRLDPVTLAIVPDTTPAVI